MMQQKQFKMGFLCCFFKTTTCFFSKKQKVRLKKTGGLFFLMGFSQP